MNDNNIKEDEETLEEIMEKLKTEFHTIVEEALQKAEYDMQHSYKGRDGRDYSDLDTLLQSDESYIQSKNLKIR